MLGVFTARSPDAWTGARAPTRASKAEEEGGKALKGAEHQREGTRAAGAARFTSHESRQHRAAASARARPHTDLGVERLQEWSAAARARATLTRWRRS